MACRFCRKSNLRVIHDFGKLPLANRLLDRVDSVEEKYPLIFSQCLDCGLLQVEHDLKTDEIFNDKYPYFTSQNAGYVDQCKLLADHLKQTLDFKSVLEVGCNDGYMLQNFKEYDHLGYEPCLQPFIEGSLKQLYIINDVFCGTKRKFDLILAFNVVGHVPNLQSFLIDICDSLTPNGTVIIEMPDAVNIFEREQWDTIYHEHFSYIDPNNFKYIVNQIGLQIYRQQRIDSHGGSYRYWLKKSHHIEVRPQIFMANYPLKIENRIAGFKLQGLKHITFFGAAAKGATFLNVAGITNQHVRYCIDETPYKKGKFMPGSRIEIVGPEYLNDSKSIYILPWNHKTEIADRLRNKYGYMGPIESEFI